MRKWLPSKKTVGVWISAAALAVLSLPSPPVLPQSGERQPAPAEASPRVGAIPTMATPDASQLTLDMAADDEVSSSQTSTSDESSRETAVPMQQPNQPGHAGQGTAPTPATPNRRPPAQNGQNQAGPSGQSPATPGPSGGTPSGQPGQGTAPAAPGQQTPPQATPGQPTPAKPDGVSGSGLPGLPNMSTQPFSPYAAWPTAKLRIRVIDGRTLQPLPDAEVVVIETEQRVKTDKDGYTPYVDAPIIRNPRYRPMVQELHGQLGVIVYKNGYRDSVHLGIRMHEGYRSETTVWMYKLGPGDTRVEPVLYQVPYHHLWLVELADKFRSKTQPGEGPERP